FVSDTLLLKRESRLFAHLLALAIDGGGGPDPAPTSGTTSTIGVPCLLQVDPLHHPGAPGVVLHIVEWDPAVATATVSTSPGAAGAPPPSPDGFVTGLNTHGTDVKTQPDGRTPMLFFLLGRCSVFTPVQVEKPALTLKVILVGYR
uniref:Uncharacterized protein n=2 Tax=Aegilops tauschii subsp. strangulata TaxID=200361 RepID=A0A453RN76_AEGTS